MKKLKLLVVAVLLSLFNYGQEWTLKLSSHVELRTWKLTTKAEKTEKSLGGASIKLFKGGALVTELSSGSDGDFTILVPANGDFVLEVSYAGCNTKKFAITTQNVPEEVGKDNYKPTFSIGGFVMAKPFPGIDYSGLQQTLVKVEYKPKGKNFDHDDAATERGISIVQKIAQAENSLIEKFCSTNKDGDAALAKPDCPLAKTLYEKAISLIPGEQYPVDQLAKVGLCLKDKEEAAKKAEEAKAAKADAAKAKTEKALAEKEAAKKAAAEKTANDKVVIKDKPVVAEKPVKEKVSNKYIKEKEVAGVDPEKAAKKKAAAEKIQKQKEGLAKSQAEDLAAEKADYEKRKAADAEKEKARAEKEAKDKENKQAAKTKDGGDMGKGDSDHSIPQVLGANKYKENILKGDDYFKTKRYTEAKTAYEAALKVKANDPYATKKLEEISQILSAKK